MFYIKHCGCTKNKRGATQGAEYQDRVYGPGKRLFTPARGDKQAENSTMPGKCTVCGQSYSPTT